METEKSTPQLYILDMGEPVKIDELARQMIRLAGLTEADIEITYTGLRPGEKLHEALAYEEEALQPTTHSAINMTAPVVPALKTIRKQLKTLQNAIHKQDRDAAITALKASVPEYE